ncbi:MAG: hypothetical protein QW279_11380 [Candidatus Jordarchaeaceae archaeon]
MDNSERQILLQILESVKSGLQLEDTILIGCAYLKSKNLQSAVKGGLLRYKNERYLQYIIAKAIDVETSWIVNTEVEHHDVELVNYLDSFPRHIFIEIKKWLSSEGEEELPDIIEDLKKLASKRNSETMVMQIVLTVQAKQEHDENLNFLLAQLGLDKKRNLIGYLAFPSVSSYHKNTEFALIGLVP